MVDHGRCVMIDFDKHWNEWAIASNCTKDEAKIHFEAGRQSQQAKIDELQSRVDGALGFTEDVHSENWQEVIHCINSILKGNKDEN